MLVVWIVLALVALAILVVSWRLSSIVVHPAVMPYEETKEEEIRRGVLDRARYDNLLHAEDFTIPSRFGYTLHGVVIPKKPDAPAFPDGRERVAVIVHGYTYSLYGSVKYAEIFRDLGITSVLYDNRNHGLSGKAPTTMGWYESMDLSTVCAYARERFGADCVLGTHGESMGAATVMMHAPTDKALAFVIEDCGYSDLSDQLAFDTRDIYHLPRFPFIPLASLFSRLRGGVFFSRVKPAARVALCDKLPMLFIHGASDDFVPTKMVLENYAAKSGPRMLGVFTGAVHAYSYHSNPVRYRALVAEFLTKYGVI